MKCINECHDYVESFPVVEELLEAHPSLFQSEVQVGNIPAMPFHVAVKEGLIIIF